MTLDQLSAAATRESQVLDLIDKPWRYMNGRSAKRWFWGRTHALAAIVTLGGTIGTAIISVVIGYLWK